MRRLTPLLAVLLALLMLGGCNVTVYEDKKAVSGKETAGAPVAETEKSRDVALVAEDGVGIMGTFYPAASQDGAILLHMLGKERSSWGSFPARLQKEGYNVLSIDLRGHGQSGLDVTAFKDDDFRNMAKDVKAAKEFLEKQANVTAAYIIGASIGANTALNYAADDKSVKAAALLSPGLEYHGVSTTSAIKRYGSRKLLIVASENDAYSADSSKKLDAAAQNSELVLYSGSGHGTDIFASKPLEEIIVQWLKQMAGNTQDAACRLDSDCVAAECCHASACTSSNNAPDCSGIMCTMECKPDTMDCGQGSCKCVEGECEAVIAGAAT